jgi:hypothetical protein
MVVLGVYGKGLLQSWLRSSNHYPQSLGFSSKNRQRPPDFGLLGPRQRYPEGLSTIDFLSLMPSLNAAL